MGEIAVNCEDKCLFFKALPPKQVEINRTARQVTHDGQEFPGSLNTFCGRCVKQKIIDFELEEKSKQLLNIK